MPLLERFVRLRESIPHVALGDWPTPVISLDRFAKLHGLESLHAKREDLSHAQCGGNKVRGLEFLLGEARSRDIKTLVTLSSAGSHHICRTAYFASKFGMKTVAVVVDQHPAEYVRANLGMGIQLGTEFVKANYFSLLPKVLKQLLRCGSGDRVPCLYVPPGGTSPLACIGHVNAALELRRQIEAGELPTPDYVYVALGSLGTAAGVALGLKIAGLVSRVVGVVTSYKLYCTRGRVARLANRTMRLMRKHDTTVPFMNVRRRDLAVVRTALGKGYARPTEAGLRLIDEMRKTQGLSLDGTYTAKMLDGAMQFIEKQKVQDKRHLLWHTYDSLPLANLSPGQVPEALKKYFESGQA